MSELCSNKNNKRNFYRLNLNRPLCVEMTITNCHGKSIKIGFSKVCVKNIGPGGLLFISKLLFPIDKGIIYNFRFSIFDNIRNINGVIVRRNEFNKNIFEYGVMFTCDDIRNEQEYVKLFNNFSIVLKRNTNKIGCKFCDEITYPCE